MNVNAHDYLPTTFDRFLNVSNEGYPSLSLVVTAEAEHHRSRLAFAGTPIYFDLDRDGQITLRHPNDVRLLSAIFTMDHQTVLAELQPHSTRYVDPGDFWTDVHAHRASIKSYCARLKESVFSILDPNMFALATPFGLQAVDVYNWLNHPDKTVNTYRSQAITVCPQSVFITLFLLNDNTVLLDAIDEGLPLQSHLLTLAECVLGNPVNKIWWQKLIEMPICDHLHFIQHFQYSMAQQLVADYRDRDLIAHQIKDAFAKHDALARLTVDDALDVMPLYGYCLFFQDMAQSHVTLNADTNMHDVMRCWGAAHELSLYLVGRCHQATPGDFITYCESVSFNLDDALSGLSVKSLRDFLSVLSRNKVTLSCGLRRLIAYAKKYHVHLPDVLLTVAQDNGTHYLPTKWDVPAFRIAEDLGHVRYLDSPAALKQEGLAMRNCVGDADYIHACVQGKQLIFHLEKNTHAATAAYRLDCDKEKVSLDQLEGPAGKTAVPTPVHYLAEMMAVSLNDAMDAAAWRAMAAQQQRLAETDWRAQTDEAQQAIDDAVLRAIGLKA